MILLCALDFTECCLWSLVNFYSGKSQTKVEIIEYYCYQTKLPKQNIILLRLGIHIKRTKKNSASKVRIFFHVNLCGNKLILLASVLII